MKKRYNFYKLRKPYIQEKMINYFDESIYSALKKKILINLNF